MEKVLELGGYSARYCGRLFVQTGYSVSRVKSSPKPGWASRMAMNLFLDVEKQHLDTFRQDLPDSFDVVIVEANSADEAINLGIEEWKNAIVVVITPFGLSGPRRNWKATSSTLLAMGGYTQLMGDEGRTPLTLPGHYVEFQTAQYAYTAATACLFAGEKKLIDVSMYETLLSLSQFTTVMWSCSGMVRGRHGSDFYWVVPSNLFQCADGWVYINIVPTFWDALALFLDRPELTLDENFSDNTLRMANRDAIHEIVASVLIEWDKQYVRERATSFRIPAGVVQTFDEVLKDEHLRTRDFWQTVEDEDGATYLSPSLPFRIDKNDRPKLKLRKTASRD